jgi:hypothetical protein
MWTEAKSTEPAFAIRTIQERTNADMGATFLSGTTISNSLTELYLLFKYLRPRALEKQGIHSFDAWAAIYARKTTDYEFSVANNIVAKERFRYFIKVPELAQFYSEITDYRTAKILVLTAPKKNDIVQHTANARPRRVYSKPDGVCQNGRCNFARKTPVIKIGRKSKMLIATDYARKMSLDMRMVSGMYEDHPDNKASHCAKILPSITTNTMHRKERSSFSPIWEPTSRANGMCTPKSNASSWKTTAYLQRSPVYSGSQK